MALDGKAICDPKGGYNFVNAILRLKIDWEMWDDGIVDPDTGEPFKLWKGSIADEQNLTVENGLQLLVNRMSQKLYESVKAAVKNAKRVEELYGTYDPIAIAADFATQFTNVVKQAIADALAEIAAEEGT